MTKIETQGIIVNVIDKPFSIGLSSNPMSKEIGVCVNVADSNIVMYPMADLEGLKLLAEQIKSAVLDMEILIQEDVNLSDEELATKYTQHSVVIEGDKTNVH